MRGAKDQQAAVIEEWEMGGIVKWRPAVVDAVRPFSGSPKGTTLRSTLRRQGIIFLGHRVVDQLPGLTASILAVALLDIATTASSVLAGVVLSTLLAVLVGVAQLPAAAWRGLQPPVVLRRILAVFLMAALLRWSLFETLADSAGTLTPGARWLVVAVGSLTVVLGLVMFVLPGGPDRTRRDLDRRLFAWYLVVYSFALRWICAAGVPLIKEESYYWNYAQHLALSYFDHPPLSGWWIALSTGLLGDSELAVRLPALMSWVIAAAFLFGFARNLSGRQAALQTVVLFSVLPMYFGVGLIITPDAPLHAAWAGCLFFLERALLGLVSGAWIGFGVCLGLGLLSKYSMALLLPALVVFLLMDKGSRRWLASRQLAGALILAALFMTPVLIWNQQNGWASLLYQGPARWTGDRDFGLPHLILASAAVLTPVGLWAVLQSVPLWRPGTDPRERGVAARCDRRKQLFVSAFTWTPLLVFAAHSLIKLPKINWTGPLWMAALPLVAGDLWTGTRWTAAGWRSQAWSRRIVNAPGFSLIVVMALGTILIWRLIGVPGLEGDQRRPFVDWESVGKEVSRLRVSIQRETSRTPLVVGMDVSEITSQLSFYDAHATTENTVGRHLLGRFSEGFGYWTTADEALGSPMIMIGFASADLRDPSLAAHFRRMGPVRPLLAGTGPATSPRLFYRVGYGYSGP